MSLGMNEFSVIMLFIFQEVIQNIWEEHEFKRLADPDPYSPVCSWNFVFEKFQLDKVIWGRRQHPWGSMQSTFYMRRLSRSLKINLLWRMYVRRKLLWDGNLLPKNVWQFHPCTPDDTEQTVSISERDTSMSLCLSLIDKIIPEKWSLKCVFTKFGHVRHIEFYTLTVQIFFISSLFLFI